MQPARIGIDMDEVICDLHGYVFDAVGNKYDLDPGLKYTRPLFEILEAEPKAYAKQIINQGDIFRDFSPMTNAVEVIEQLNKKYEIFIISAAMHCPAALRPKFDWVCTHLPFFDPLNLVLCGHKYFANVDYLIDDTPAHLESCSGEGILFTGPRNHSETRFKRVDTWADVADLFL